MAVLKNDAESAKSDRKIGFYAQTLPLYTTIVYGKSPSSLCKIWVKFGINYFGQYNISTSWGDLSIETIVSGFAKVGILTDTRVAEAMPTEDVPQIESCLVEELENCNLVDGEVGSDDDIKNESDSDDESNL
ncbi:unnamed protein product [Phytophthora fragariaefolia]|uniref:Unnamed protein product n=1 Tax=Phytophthora fragariaefolia TaxID=1490495 RepID=A0A9W6TJD0_9STRA|nr:unnamed protein product [Phytophthora fragariaefolia]